MNGYDSRFYIIIAAQFEPGNLVSYLASNDFVYEKTMNGRYQVGSGRIVTVTHDTPFIEDIISQKQLGNQLCFVERLNIGSGPVAYTKKEPHNGA